MTGLWIGAAAAAWFVFVCFMLALCTAGSREDDEAVSIVALLVVDTSGSGVDMTSVATAVSEAAATFFDKVCEEHDW